MPPRRRVPPSRSSDPVDVPSDTVVRRTAASPAPLPSDVTPERTEAQIELLGELTHDLRADVERALDSTAEERKNISSRCQETLAKIRRAQCAALSGMEHLREKTGERNVEVNRARTRAGTMAYETATLERELRDFEREDGASGSVKGVDLMDRGEYEADARARGLDTEAADEYDEMKKRWAHELIVRKELVERQKALTLDLAEVKAAIEERKKTLSGDPGAIKAMKRHAEELRRKFDLPYTTTETLDKQVAVLPGPLYILYAQLKHAQQMGEDIRVQILGREADAEAYEEAMENPTATDDGNVRDERDGRKRQRGGRGGRGRGGRGMKLSSSTYAEHPLRIELDGVGGRKVIFNYLTKLHMVIARANPGKDDPLKDLFPGDDGSATPNHAIEIVESDFTFDASCTGYGGKPYKWAQDLAGMSFLPSVPRSRAMIEKENLDGKAVTSKARVVDVLRAIRERFDQKKSEDAAPGSKKRERKD